VASRAAIHSLNPLEKKAGTFLHPALSNQLKAGLAGIVEMPDYRENDCAISLQSGGKR
jgi:hypothetical protein